MVVMMAALLGPAIYFILRARRGRKPKIRRIPGIDAIEEAIGRATELGRPIVFTTGLTGLSPLLYACLGILSHVARRAARMGTRLIVPQCDYEVMPIVEEAVREAYRDEGKLEEFRREDIRFLSPSQFAFASGYMGIVHRERAATCFLFGSFAAESLILGEAGQQVGAMQVAGTTSNEQVPFFITTCDYTLIGEELYAAGAYLSQESSQLGGLRGQDVAKVFTLGTIFLGLVFAFLLTLFRGDSEEGRMYASPFTRALYAKPMSRRCLARLEVNVPFEPAMAPPWDELNPDQGKVSRKICEAAESLARRLHTFRRELEEQAGWIRGKAGLIRGDRARRSVEEVAAGFDEAASRASKEAEAVARCAEEQLRAEKRYIGIEGAVFLARSRPLVKRIADWSETEWGDKSVGEAAALARGALEELAASPADRDAYAVARKAVGEAYELAHDRYCDLARERLRKLRKLAASDQYPAGDGPLVFNAAKALDADGDELLHTWDFGDESGLQSGPSPMARHAFGEPGEYAVTLSVSDKRGSQTFNVAPPPAKDSAVFRLETTAGTELELNWPLPSNAVERTAEFRWDFGGDDQRAEQSAKHVYEKPGRHTLRVEAKYQVEEEEREEAGEGPLGSAEAEPALAYVRAHLGERLRAVEDLAAKVEDDAATLLELLGKMRASFPEDAAVARDERELLRRDAERTREVLKWADDQGRGTALLRGRVELLGAEAKPPTEAREGGRGGKRVTKTRRQVAKVYWTVEPEYAHKIEKKITVAEAEADIPPPWTYEPEDAREGGSQ
jgi:hypothetical protein